MGNRHSAKILLVLTLIITVLLAACTGSQDELPVTQEISATAVPEGTPDLAPTETVVPTAPVPAFPEINNIGSDWIVNVSDPAELGEEKTYTHYPPSTVQYDVLFLDDELVAAEYICSDETRDLSGWFSPAEEAVDGVVPYKSWPIDFFRQGCRIDLTVKNTEGDTIGLRFESHCPTCHY